jgi:hypothetical protein
VLYLYQMNNKCKCEKCGASVEIEYEPPFQEYPGAKVWGGTWYAACTEECGWEKLSDQDLSGYSIRENTRGW